jgi:hypothetical protein
MTQWFVICGVLASGSASAQVARGAKVSKEPRALGLLELSPDGKAHLIPITILIDGKYYDAGAYKAAPVPMALWGDTVYEAIRTGVSQGLFTVKGAMQRKDTSEWMAEGTWQSASAIAAKVPKKPSSSEPRGLNDDAGPPVLRHSGGDKAKPADAATPTAVQPTPAASPGATSAISAPASSTPATNTSASSTSAGGSSTAPPSPTPSSSTAPSSTPTADQAMKTSADSASQDQDKDLPVLKRGKPSTGSNEDHENYVVTATKGVGHVSATPTKAAPLNPASPASPSSSAASAMQFIPAISDSNGPEPRPYSYDMKSEEEIAFRKKMLAIAADEVRARARQLAGDSTVISAPRGKTKAAKLVPPDFEDVQLRVFDLASVNEPELVLTAKARLPHQPSAKDDASPDLQYMVTLVARVDVNGEFHKAFVNVTDTQHLDVLPRLDLIDAVDVDGDGRGELLFRQVSDAGTAFVVYRVIGDQLYPLFQGVPAGS